MNQSRLGVWGLGHIGYTSTIYFAECGYECLGFDINPKRVFEAQNASSSLVGVDSWLSRNSTDLVNSGLIQATEDWKEVAYADVVAHLLCIPTEKDGEPQYDALKNVVRKIALALYEKAGKDKESSQPVVIIESTISPSIVDDIVLPIFAEKGLNVGKDFYLAVAPRRDWFGDADHSIHKIPRILGGCTPECTRIASELLSHVCEQIHEAHDHRHAALVKGVENAYRQVEITLANELANAFPELDIRQVLELASTKWNMGLYRPGLGTGGYCIPMGPRYVMEGCSHPERLKILGASLKSDLGRGHVIMQKLHQHEIKRPVIFGLSYAPNQKIHVLSPTLRLINELCSSGSKPLLFDPLYSDQEIEEIASVETFDLEKGDDTADALVISVVHGKSQELTLEAILSRVPNCKYILDAAGFFQKSEVEKHGISYELVGSPSGPW